MTTKHLLKTAMAAAFMLLLCFTTKAQSVTMFIQSGGFDNCSNPLPNAGTYTHSGSVNGKNAYVKNAQLKIIWTGSQWELQGWDNTVYSTPNFLTLWYNTNNTATPPADCWAASFGCFPIGMSGPDAFPAMSVAPTLTTANADTTNATTEIEKSFGFLGMKDQTCSKNKIEIRNNISNIKKIDTGICNNDYDMGF